MVVLCQRRQRWQGRRLQLCSPAARPVPTLASRAAAPTHSALPAAGQREAAAPMRHTWGWTLGRPG